MSAVAGPRAFFFIRHGETDWNREGRLQGQLDIPLTPLGERQAATAGATLGRLLDRRALAPAERAFVVSPLRRARDTMRILRTALGLPAEPVLVDDRLKELSFGTWEGRTWSELKEKERGSVDARRRAIWIYRPPGGESYVDLADRVAAWLANLPDHAVVVAHGGVARVLFHLVAGVAAEEAAHREIHQGRVLVFEAGQAHWA